MHTASSYCKFCPINMCFVDVHDDKWSLPTSNWSVVKSTSTNHVISVRRYIIVRLALFFSSLISRTRTIVPLLISLFLAGVYRNSKRDLGCLSWSACYPLCWKSCRRSVVFLTRGLTDLMCRSLCSLLVGVYLLSCYSVNRPGGDEHRYRSTREIHGYRL